MDKELWYELEAQVESHGPQSVVFEMETDRGSGEVTVKDIVFEDDHIKVTLI